MNLPAHLAVALLSVQAVAGERTPPPADSVRTHRHARAIQMRFERLRVRNLPRTPGGGSQECDEIIGRLCVWDDGDDDWQPKEEPAAVVDARNDLLAGLDSLAALIPGDHWVLGQRIRYLVEAGRLGDAETVARNCGLPGRWRCDAYLGYVLHHRTEFVRSEAAFRRALEEMPADMREDWTSPAPVLERELRRWLAAQPDSAAALARLWTLADPLFLVEGNDRWTAHMSRWSYSMSSERAANPYDINWGRDFTQVAVRYGWPIAWERSWPPVGQTGSRVSGRDRPGAFRAFPPREIVARGLSGEEPVAWDLEEDHARASYLPAYLDSIGALDAQVGRFWRPGHVVVVAAWRAPDGTGSVRVGGPGGDEGAPEGGPVFSGLFVERKGEVVADVRTVAESGSTVRLSARVPWADWGIVSMEGWAPDARVAHRQRAAMGFPQLPIGLFAVSDLVLLESGAQPSGLDELAGLLRPGSEIGTDERLDVALEVYGLGSRRETIQFSARVEEREGFFRRMARRMGLLGPQAEVSVAWREDAPRSAEPLFRTLQFGLSGLKPGEYALVVEVSAPARATLRTERRFTVTMTGG